MNHLFFLKELCDSKFRYLRIIILFSVLIFSTIALVTYINAIVNWSIEPYKSAQYDYKLVALINDSVEKKLSENPYVEKIAFVLVTDLYLNDKRVTAALIDHLNKINLTIYNSATLKSGKFEEKGIVVSEKLAKKIGIEMGDAVIINPIRSMNPIMLKVTGIFRSQTITGNIADAILEYPNEYREYFRKSLPYNALYGEAYIKFKGGDLEDKRRYAELINALVNLQTSSHDKIILRDDRVKSMTEYYAKEFNTPIMIAVKYSGVFLFFVMAIHEAITYSGFAKRAYRPVFKFSNSFMLIQYLLMTTSIILFSGGLAIIYAVAFSKFYLGVAQQIDFTFVSILLFMTILASWTVFYIRTRKEAEL